MKDRDIRRQRGAALIVLLVIIVLGTSWMVVSALGKAANRTAVQREHNARVLAEAKAALVAWVATNAFDSTENNPGRLPCPQYWGDVGSSNEGRAGASCISSAAPTQPAAGWLPWRSLGLSKLLDASGAQLWYAVSPGWASRTDAAYLTINSISLGQLTVDGQANASVAMIIAPGQALGISPNSNQVAAGCVARNQSQALNLPTTAPNPLDFLECQNGSTTDGSFATSVVDNATNPVFNDQVVTVTAADVLPALEAAIAKRIERDIVPALSAVYGTATWGTSASSPAFPFPATFADPTTSPFQGNTAATQGLVPFNYHSSSCGSDARCSNNAITWGTPSLSSSGGPGYLPLSPTCTVSGSTGYCYGYYYGGTLNISIGDPATSITTGLRTVDVASHTGSADAWRYNGSSWDYLGSQAATVSRSLTSNGAANFNASVALPSVSDWGYYYIYNNRPSDSDFGDHAILNSTDSTTGWFVRNEWYRFLYYAIAQGYAPGGSLSCVSGGSGSTGCLQVTNLTDPTKQRAVLVLAGRSLSSLAQTRPSSSLQDYLDSTENRNGDSIFVQSPVGRSFNDRFISVSKNP